jgi:signal transduction histidine kinase/ActR/RegA family two-component response regulator/PAS domain-containing protein
MNTTRSIENDLLYYHHELVNEPNIEKEDIQWLLDAYRDKVLADQDIIDQQNHALEAFFSTMDCGIIRHAIDENEILGINQAALQLLDYKDQEEMERLGFDLIAPSVVEEDQPKLRDAIRKLKDVGDRINVGYQVRHRNGDILDLMCRVKLLEEDGRRICQRVIMDCTEQRLYEKKILRKKEKYWNEIISALSVDYSSAFYLDIDTGIGFAYRLPERIKTAYADIISNHLNYVDMRDAYIREYVHPQDREQFYKDIALETIRQQLSNKDSYYITYRIIREGKIEYFQTKVVRVGNWEKKHCVMVGFRNIDEKVQAELEQKKMMADALIRAEQASIAKTNFLNSMSHDIRTPMNAIIGFTTLAKTHFDEQDRVRDYLDKITTASNHLLSLINDILDMSRIESGKLSLKYTACNLAEIVKDLNTVMSGQIKDKNIHFTLDMNIRHENVLCDKLRLNQVLLNILGNAVKFTHPDGNVFVSVDQYETNEKDGFSRYQFRIKDSGIGMSEEFQEHLFEPFTRETNLVGGIPGTGLGLAITKNIVDIMDGKISVMSKTGEGTEFLIDFSFEMVEASNVNKETEITGDCLQEEWKRKRILLVEDNLLNQEIASEVLTDFGFKVETAENGSEAVKKVKDSSPGYFDVILMDIQMPIMNGHEAARKIRKLPNQYHSSIPIIAMTANAFEEDRRAAIEAGMNDFVQKPLDIGKLLNALRLRLAE